MEFLGWLYSLLSNLFFRSQRKTDTSKEKKSLDHPLSHYYIQGSHNTYLLGNQLVGSSTIEGYTRAINNGCRCVELDLYNGRTEAVIYHGHTLTSKLIAREVLQYGIMPGFQKDSLPLFLSIEDNITSDEQRLHFIQDLKNIFGDFLYNQNISGMVHLPSPNDLRGKIIIMAPKIKWDELASILKYAPFPKNALTSNLTYQDNCFDILNLSEHTLNRLITPTFEENDETAAEDRIIMLRNLTKNNLVRYYPGFHRQLSGNFDPIPGMNAGCQIAAMNVQTKCSNLTIIESRFREHGSTGFALKPDFILNANASPLGTKIITIKDISGSRLLDHQKEHKTKFLFVNFCVNGVKEDKVKKNTKPLKTDGKNPQWNEEFTFTLTVPELGFILIQVKSSNNFGLKMRTIGSYSIPITEMKNGPTIIRLQDQFCNQHSHASLFFEVKIVHSL